MYAFKGDRILVPGDRSGTRKRAVVISCDHADGHPPYWVRWEGTDRESLCFPDPAADIEHAGPSYPAEYDAD